MKKLIYLFILFVSITLSACVNIKNKPDRKQENLAETLIKEGTVVDSRACKVNNSGDSDTYVCLIVDYKNIKYLAVTYEVLIAGSGEPGLYPRYIYQFVKENGKDTIKKVWDESKDDDGRNNVPNINPNPTKEGISI